MLHSTYQPQPDSNQPCLVWLHGFLGSQQEWHPVAQHFASWPQLFIDLPGHGASADIQVEDFQQTDALLKATLTAHQISRYWLIGYSLGGRIAMYHAAAGAKGLVGMVVEGGNPGLVDEAERQPRRENDHRWAERLRQEPIEQVLSDWYRQPVFSSLTANQRTALVALRRQNNPLALAAMLEATSLGRQPNLRPTLQAAGGEFHYLCGERDDKFRAIATMLGFPAHTIASAGHNAHREQPEAVARCLRTLMR